MSREVKSIFCWLIGTIVVILVASLFTELINVNVYGIQLQQITRMACDKSLELFSQETYKLRDSSDITNEEYASKGVNGGSSSVDDILTCDGDSYISGDFYGGMTSVKDIYNSIYRSTNFERWMKDTGAKGNWYTVNLINRKLNYGKDGVDAFEITQQPTFSVPEDAGPNYDYEEAIEKFEDDMKKYTDYNMAENYVNSYMTPLNLGIPYIDPDITQKMFQWNLARLLSDCDSNTIISDAEYGGTGKYCIRKNGFLIYAQDAKITGLNYKVYDLNDPAEQDEFESYTHIDADELGFSDDISYMHEMSNGDERKRVCIVGVEYSVPMTYIGVSPIKRIFNYVWNTEVDGYNGNGANRGSTQTYEYDSDSLVGGGFAGNNEAIQNGALPVPGKLIYYLVR